MSTPIVGSQLKILLCGATGLVGCMGFGSAFGKVRARDDWIGWTGRQRRANLPRVINQVRFLLLPWIRCPGLASHTLGLAARQVPELWKQRYADRPLLLETFVDAICHQGICYSAANWLYLGPTSGYGKWKSS